MAGNRGPFAIDMGSISQPGGRTLYFRFAEIHNFPLSRPAQLTKQMDRGSEIRAGAVSDPVTGLLLRWSQGDVAAREQLIPLVYKELRRIAKRCLASQPHNTLQSTALVHEAYIRLAGSSIRWEDRVHFFAVSAQLMRRILVDYIRMKRARKRGGGALTLVLDENLAVSAERELDLIALDDALNTLATIDERQARLVELRFFAGLSIDEAAHALEISPATVKREWATAKLWLLQQIRRSTPA
jgi:RNA polymerase sigma factor (TIGR02999 family)